MSTILPRGNEWEEIRKQIDKHVKICENLKSTIATKKDDIKDNEQILTWISPDNNRLVYNDILHRTGVGSRYPNACQWFIDDEEFQKWFTADSDSVLWARGNMGTGKTTLFARAAEEVAKSYEVEIEAHQLAIYIFSKSHNDSKSPLDVKFCMLSIARQLAWNPATSGVEPAAAQIYNAFKANKHSDNTSIGAFVELIQKLLWNKRTFIMVDGIDECENGSDLLSQLKNVMAPTSAPGEGKVKGHVHLLLCSRSQVPVLYHFKDCSTITTIPAASRIDQEAFIRTSIDKYRVEIDGNLFFNSELNLDFPSQLQRILNAKGNGLFRWIEIKIEEFARPAGEYLSEQDIEDKLVELEKSTIVPALRDEYTSLLGRLNEKWRNMALRMLRFIACSFAPLSAKSLAEAVTLSKIENLEAKQVRQLLRGFVYEEEKHYSRTKSHVPASPCLTIAHASVLEFFEEESGASTFDFTPEAQHNEAAQICLDSILNMNVLDEVPHDRMTLENHRQGMSALEFYSCSCWGVHDEISRPIHWDTLYSGWQRSLVLFPTLLVEDFDLGMTEVSMRIAYEHLARRFKSCDPGQEGLLDFEKIVTVPDSASLGVL